MEVIIIGAGIGGLTLALELHRCGIPSQIFEAQPDIAHAGVGINILPDALRNLFELGLGPQLEATGVTIEDETYFNRFGQLIWQHRFDQPSDGSYRQIAIHRGEFQSVLFDAVKMRIGAERIHADKKCDRVEQTCRSATAYFSSKEGLRSSHEGRVVIGCDGIHSAVRRQLHPHESAPIYSGYTMWRGLSHGRRYLSGASLTRAGWLVTGQLIAYPIKNLDDGEQLINWVAIKPKPERSERDWNRQGALEDFISSFQDWKFDWLDVPELLKNSGSILEFPMVDLDPLARWSLDRVSLLGDAAHPMYPRGANGARQAILDARALAEALATEPNPIQALKAYEAIRLAPTSEIILRNRTNPPDAILRLAHERTNDTPFANVEDVFSKTELLEISGSYRRM